MDVMLQECAREPIHLLGRTQRFGFLMAIDAARRIAAMSGNALEWCGREPASLIGAQADSVLPRGSIEAAFAHARIAEGQGVAQHLHHLAWPGRTGAVDVSVHASQGLVVIEVEPAGADPTDGALTIETCTRELATLRSVPELARSATTAVAGLTGYDRVMVYHFAADGSGTVIAEHLAAGQESYVGLRYPAGDIPPQARALYLRNPTRVIFDARDEGLPVHTASETPLDLSLAVLRNVSPVHLQYLRNMGTAASMSISLIVDGRLWGLIACHHRTPMRPTLACRAMSELLGRLYGLAIARAERQPLEADIKALLLASPGVDPLVDPAALPADHDAACTAIGRLMEVTGVATCIDGRVTTWGLAPSHARVVHLAQALAGKASQAVTPVESLKAFLPGMGRLAPKVAGLLALPLAAHGRDWVLLLRDEVLRHVHWAGNPDKAVQRRPDGQLSPRTSFAAWRASVRGHCEPWTVADIELARIVRTRLIESLAAHREQRAIESTRRAARQQALLVRELNHRVRNMLGLIKGLVQQTARSATSIEDLSSRLHDRVHALSRAYTRIEKAHWQPTPLADLVLEETTAFAEPGQVSIAGDPIHLEAQACLSFALVIHELATNARKYGALSLPQGRLFVRWRVTDTGALEIDWRERDGPLVAKPTRQGFGTRVIRQALEHQLRGHVVLDFERTGLRARLWAPRGFVPGTPQAKPPRTPAPGAGRMPAQASARRPSPALAALVVEDDLVIALLAESMLQHLGYDPVLTVGTADDALELLQTRRVDVAMLDVNLGDHSSEDVALRLAALGVPTLVTTGYSDNDSVPEPLRALQRVAKPYTLGDLEVALAAITAAPPAEPAQQPVLAPAGPGR
jgi:light-regulated signal transduction histidine kinase (bacteriophytochrome)/CheY-like chemotaxis protein